MNFILLQVVLLFFALFMLYVLYIHWKKKHVSNLFFCVWVVLWVAFSIIDIYPEVLRGYLSEFYIVRVLDLCMIFSFMVLSYITIENNIVIKNLNNKIEALVREMAKEKHGKR